MGGRSVEEWIADNPDQAIPTRVKLRIWEREKGICSLTGRKILPSDSYDFEHRIALCNGGEHKESNIFLALRGKPHKEKTAADVAEKSKVNRVRAKHLGIHKKSGRKLQSRGFQKISGVVIERTDR